MINNKQFVFHFLFIFVNNTHTYFRHGQLYIKLSKKRNCIDFVASYLLRTKLVMLMRIEINITKINKTKFAHRVTIFLFVIGI